MRKNNSVRRCRAHPFGNIQGNSLAHKSRLIIFAVLALALFAAVCFFPPLVAFAEESGEDKVYENIVNLLEKLDLAELDKLLSETDNAFIFEFGGTAKDIINYLLRGNANTDYSGYLKEIFSVIFKDVIKILPSFATVTAIALLSAVVSAAEGSILGKSTSKIVHLACYSLIILVISSMLTGVVSSCMSCINSLKKQIEIITPILATLTVLTGGTNSAAIYQPSAVFLSGGAVEIVNGFIFPATITVIVLNFLSKLNPDISFSGVSALIKSIMKWAIGITVTVFGIFISAQSAASTLFDGIIFKAAKFAIGNSVPIVGNFLSGGFDMLASAGLIIKSSVGLCGIFLILGEIVRPVVVLVSFSVILKAVGAIVQPIGENMLYSLLSDLSKDIEYFIAGLLTVAFLYALVIMLVISSANSFI